MNSNIVKGNWEELKGVVKKQWGRLTDDDLAQIDGDRMRLSGRIQKLYGLQKDEVERQIKDIEDQMAA